MRLYDEVLSHSQCRRYLSLGIVPLKMHELYTRHVFPLFSSADFPDEARIERMAEVSRHWFDLCRGDPSFEVSDFDSISFSFFLLCQSLCQFVCSVERWLENENTRLFAVLCSHSTLTLESPVHIYHVCLPTVYRRSFFGFNRAWCVPSRLFVCGEVSSSPRGSVSTRRTVCGASSSLRDSRQRQWSRCSRSCGCWAWSAD